jgi:hypothetical protein
MPGTRRSGRTPDAPNSHHQYLTKVVTLETLVSFGMSYTLTMATDQEPKIAADGVQDVPLTKARPLLTRLIEQALEEKLVSALTVRGRRRVYLVTPEFYERATKALGERPA